jgi:hypothetical protein
MSIRRLARVLRPASPPSRAPSAVEGVASSARRSHHAPREGRGRQGTVTLEHTALPEPLPPWRAPHRRRPSACLGNAAPLPAPPPPALPFLPRRQVLQHVVAAVAVRHAHAVAVAAMAPARLASHPVRALSARPPGTGKATRPPSVSRHIFRREQEDSVAPVPALCGSAAGP